MRQALLSRSGASLSQPHAVLAAIVPAATCSTSLPADEKKKVLRDRTALHALKSKDMVLALRRVSASRALGCLVTCREDLLGQASRALGWCR